jgi:preprotein translocase subunit SecE
MTNRRLLGFVYLALALPIAMVYHSMLSWLWRAMDIPMTVGGLPLLVPLAIVVIGVTAVAFWKHPKAYTFLEEVLVELRKVVWPRMQEVQDSTIIVILTTLVVAMMLGGFDLIWAKISNLILYR